mgnify:CR=1 FL=1
MTRKTLLTLAVLTAISAGTAFAAPPATPAAAPEARAKLDTNNDGFIDRAEAAKHPRLAVVIVVRVNAVLARVAKVRRRASIAWIPTRMVASAVLKPRPVMPGSQSVSMRWT